jgi:chemotaxis protein CheX
MLEHLDMRVSLPTVITGKCHCIEFPTKVTPLCIPFKSPWGDITVEVGLCELSSTAVVAANEK